MVRYEWKPFVCALLFFHGHLLYRWLGVGFPWEEPHLDESHRLVGQVVDFAVPHAASDCGVLDPALLENAAFAILICVSEFALHDVCDNLIAGMWMKWPHGSRRQRIIIEHPKSSKLDELFVIVFVKAEVPSATEAAVLDSSLCNVH